MLLALSINTPLGYPPGLANTAAQGLAGPKCGPVHPHAKLAKLAVKVLTAVLNPPALQIIPIENIQGRKAVEAGDLCMRKTAAGVDLNRNWAHAWTAVRTPFVRARSCQQLHALGCTGAALNRMAGAFWGGTKGPCALVLVKSPLFVTGVSGGVGETLWAPASGSEQ